VFRINVCIPGRGPTVKPLIVSEVVNVFSMASTMSGAASGVGAMFSTRCLNVQTPEPVVRAGSSTTDRSLIMSSRAVLPWQPAGSATTKLTTSSSKNPDWKPNTSKNSWKVCGSTESSAVAVIVKCPVVPGANVRNCVNPGGGVMVTPGKKLNS